MILLSVTVACTVLVFPPLSEYKKKSLPLPCPESFSWFTAKKKKLIFSNVWFFKSKERVNPTWDFETVISS